MFYVMNDFGIKLPTWVDFNQSIRISALKAMFCILLRRTCRQHPKAMLSIFVDTSVIVRNCTLR